MLEVRVEPMAQVEGHAGLGRLAGAAFDFSADVGLFVPPEAEALRQRWLGHLEEAVRRHGKGRIRVIETGSVPDAHVFGARMIAMSGGVILRETVQRPKRLAGLRPGGWTPEMPAIYNGRGTLSIAEPELPRPGERTAYLLGQATFDNYYHWLVEIIPRIPLMKAALAFGMQLVGPPLKQEFQRQSLRFHGLDPASILEIRRPWRFPRCVVSTPFAAGNTWLSSEIARFFRAGGAGGAAGASGVGSRRIYITRRAARNRRVLNEAELLPMLLARGFEVVALEAMDFAEQVRLFADAACIIGPHGAGLANMVHAPAGARVVELLHDSFEAGATSYYALSQLFGLRYSLVVGPARPGGEAGANADFVIPPALLGSAMADLA